MLFLRSVPGNLVVLSWLYDRAARWTLDRSGVRGHEGLSLLKSADDDAEEDEDSDELASRDGNGIGSVNVPNRRVYAIDLRCSTHADDFIRLEAAALAAQPVPPSAVVAPVSEVVESVEAAPTADEAVPTDAAPAEAEPLAETTLPPIQAPSDGLPTL